MAPQFAKKSRLHALLVGILIGGGVVSVVERARSGVPPPVASTTSDGSSTIEVLKYVQVGRAG